MMPIRRHHEFYCSSSWGRGRDLFFGGLVATTISICGLGPAEAQEEGWFKRNFIDPEDGALDASAWLSNGGFLPIPLVITEPAVDNGVGLAFGFIGKGDPERDIPPNFTGLAAAVTGNDSKIYAAFHDGTYLAGDLKLSGFVANGDINLDFFTGGSEGFSYNFNGLLASATGLYRIRKSNWFAGGTWRFQDSDVQLRGDSQSDLLPTSLNTKISGLGLVLDYQSLDNIFTPTDGISARLASVRYDDKIGSDFEYTNNSLSVFAFNSPSDRLTLGGKFVAQGVTGDAPFFALPYIDLRGIPAIRYQGETALSTEIEATYKFANRWRAVGFAGTGRVESDYPDADESWQSAVGVGIRYRIARELGIDLGLDVARGPEETVVYLQFGRAWRRF